MASEWPLTGFCVIWASAGETEWLDSRTDYPSLISRFKGASYPEKPLLFLMKAVVTWNIDEGRKGFIYLLKL